MMCYHFHFSVPVYLKWNCIIFNLYLMINSLCRLKQSSHREFFTEFLPVTAFVWGSSCGVCHSDGEVYSEVFPTLHISETNT